jgi:hypothetical protein
VNVKFESGKKRIERKELKVLYGCNGRFSFPPSLSLWSVKIELYSPIILCLSVVFV